MERERKKVIIDCDPGIDDSLALMLALSMEELSVAGITIVCGNGPVDMGFSNGKKILKKMGRLDIPVFKGEEKPLKREYVSALDTHGADGLGESFLPEVPGYEQPVGAVEYMEKELLKGGCSVIALGPMTNLARLIEREPKAFARIEELVSMATVRLWQSTIIGRIRTLRHWSIRQQPGWEKRFIWQVWM